MESQQNKPILNEIISYTNEDIEKNKNIAGLAYLIFFLPLMVCPESEFGKFHANQSLLLWIVAIVGRVALGYVPFIGWVILPLFNLAALIFGIVGMVNAFGGKAEELPIIGEYRIIK